MKRAVRSRAARWLGGLLLLVALVVGTDARRAPAEQWFARALVGLVHVYQWTLSPLYTRMGVQCRFTPTCSHYAEAAIRRFGATRGGWLAGKRLLRCGPWTPAGTSDPPPA
ncbi:MAG: membrane protein insertion efficiency factor YidD [Acidobacteriota bacterium]